MAIEEPPAVAQEDADYASSDDSGDSYTAQDGLRFHWKFIEMEKQYFRATEEIAVLWSNLEREDPAHAAAKNRVSEVETHLAESEANVAGELTPLF